MTSILKNFPNWPAANRVHAFVTERTGGFSTGKFASLNLAHHVNDDFSTVERNRDLLQLSVPADLTFQWLNQIHSDIVNVVNVSSPPMKGDSLICREPGIACCVLTADCLPVFLTNLKGTEIAIIHAGWRGICGGILSKTVSKMCSEPYDLIAWLGPAIGPCHYEVGGDLKDAFKKSISSNKLWSRIETCFRESSTEGKFFLDLYKTAKAILNYLGVRNIYGGNQCTFRDSEKYFSYRRDGETGRMVSTIFIDPKG
jgi:YfiH family protein